MDDQKVASTTVAPYDATANLADFKSGQHAVKSEVVVEDGETFCNPPTSINLTNQPDDARLAKLAKDEADRQAQLQKEDDEKKARVAKQVSDEATAKVEAVLASKRQEEAYKTEIVDNTILAVRQSQLSIALDGNLSKIGDCYLFSLKVTNRTSKGVGPIIPDMRFDDFSFTEPLAYDGSLTNPFDESGFPSKYLSDPYHDLVVPANSTKSFSFFVANLLASERTRKPTKIGFMGTLRVFVFPLNP